MQKPDADPHGGAESFRDIKNSYASSVSDDVKRGFEDEMN